MGRSKWFSSHAWNSRGTRDGSLQLRRNPEEQNDVRVGSAPRRAGQTTCLFRCFMHAVYLLSICIYPYSFVFRSMARRLSNMFVAKLTQPLSSCQRLHCKASYWYPCKPSPVRLSTSKITALFSWTSLVKCWSSFESNSNQFVKKRWSNYNSKWWRNHRDLQSNYGIINFVKVWADCGSICCQICVRFVICFAHSLC